jgi:acyl carrier protein
MDRGNILKQVNDVFSEVLDVEDLILSDTTTANDVEDWDSLNHIQLVVAIEKEFKIRFSSKEIQSWGNVGELINCIQKKQQNLSL